MKPLEKLKSKPSSGAASSSTKKPQSISSSAKKTSTYTASSRGSEVNISKSPSRRNDSSKKFSGNKTSNKVECRLSEGGHFMSSCSTYTTPKSRRERCVEIGRCSNCSSTKHAARNCPAKQYGLDRPCGLCRSSAHITALCSAGAKAKGKSPRPSFDDDEHPSSPKASGASSSPGVTSRSDLCINNRTSASNCILPTVSLTVKRGNKSVLIRALLDFGSQSSYFCDGVMNKLGVDINSLPSSQNTIKTFLGEQERSMRSIDLELGVCCGSLSKHSIFIDPDLDVSFEVKGLIGAINIVRTSGYRIADRFYAGRHGDFAGGIQGLLGVDVLSKLKHFRVVNCLGGSAIETCHGYIPFGPVKTFLTPAQIETIFGSESKPDHSCSPETKSGNRS